MAPVAFGAQPDGTIYPSGPSIPENLLRIEIRFAKPIRTSPSAESTKLYDAQGTEIDRPFLDLPLLSPDQKRLTILMHPGRVKSGVSANLEVGRALHAGSTVTFTFDDPSISTPLRKTWLIGPPITQALQTSNWVLVPPARGTRDLLKLSMDSPISSTAENLIIVRDPDGTRVQGVTHLEAAETQWYFRPSKAWSSGEYSIMVHPDLEDPAGNRQCAPFEAVAVSQVRCERPLSLPFVARKL
ncbi:hypothetical protein [Solimonas sp. K1W22B-7]|uniref:hypothetical protein n=1 Tax=Solimonas sp. K1W22B-7 TaxID=2303331 RepID=UPI0013C40B18|nr:hypothetical protein [Solimonas sp. K1W22B-7]